jgi:NTP pyrophosphatase (non-canonical NTP hydrolase)
MQEMIAKVLQFRDERDWKQFHDPKSLAASICIEAAELLELFQWLTPDEARRQVAEKRERVSEELADVAIYLIELADVAGIELAQAIEAKLEKNANKYPVDRSRGVWTKYTELK